MQNGGGAAANKMQTAQAAAAAANCGGGGGDSAGGIEYAMQITANGKRRTANTAQRRKCKCKCARQCRAGGNSKCGGGSSIDSKCSKCK